LERSKGMDAGKITDARAELAQAEQASGAKESRILTQLVSRLERDVNGAGDQTKVQMLAGTLRELTSTSDLARR